MFDEENVREDNFEEVEEVYDFDDTPEEIIEEEIKL